MPNTPIEYHPLTGTEHTYKPGLPPYDPALDTEPGVLVVGPGMKVTVILAFQNWNDIPGLDMLYVRCHETGYHTHVTPGDLGLPPLGQEGAYEDDDDEDDDEDEDESTPAERKADYYTEQD